HPCLRRARRGEIVGPHDDTLAAFLLLVDAHLVGFFVGRRFTLLLFSPLFLLRLERGLDDRLVVLCGLVVWLRREHVVVGLDRLFVSVVLGFRIAEREAARCSLYLPEALGGGEEIIGAIGGNAAPHWVGEQFLGSSVIATVKRNASLL